MPTLGTVYRRLRTYVNTEHPRPHPLVLATVLILVMLWQTTFMAAGARLDATYRNTAATGLTASFGNFVYFFYYFGVLPVTSSQIPEEYYSREGAEHFVHEQGQTLRTDQDYRMIAGDVGKILLFMPAAWLRGTPSEPSIVWQMQTLFIGSLLLLLMAAWYVNRFVLGVFLVLLIGSHPFQVFEVYGNLQDGVGQVFSLLITTAVLMLGIHFPLIFEKNLPKVILFALPIISGSVLATVRQFRGEPYILMVALALTYLTTGQLSFKLRFGLCLLLGGTAFLTSSLWEAYFDYKAKEAYNFVAAAGGQPQERLRAYHHLWHPIWCGLGDFDDKYGFAWNDALAMETIKPRMEADGLVDFDRIPGDPNVYPKLLWMLPEYDHYIRDDVLDHIQQDPTWYLNILRKRAQRLLTEVAPLRLAIGVRTVTLGSAGWLLLPTLVLLVILRKWSYVKLLLFCLTTSLPAFVIYSGNGMAYYSMYLQVLGAFYFALAFAVIGPLLKHWNQLKRLLPRVRKVVKPIADQNVASS